jgi:hypothetical protein
VSEQPRAREIPWAILVGAGVVAMACAVAITAVWFNTLGAQEIHDHTVIALLAVWSAAWAAALIPLWRGDHRASRRQLLWVIIVAVATRVCLLLATPQFSDDLWRYLWEGRLQMYYVDPYIISPARAEPVALSSHDPYWAHVNNPELTSIYPPLAQVIFAIVAEVAYFPWAMKAVMVLGDLGVMALLIAMMRTRGRSPLWAAIAWGWSPLVVFEVAGQGHIDALAVLCAVLWLWLLERRLEFGAAGALGVGISVKLVPALLLPAAMRWHRMRWTVLFAPVVVVLLALPYINSQTMVHPPPSMTWHDRLGLDNMTRSLREYASRWRNNESVFALAYGGAIAVARLATPSEATWESAGRSHLARAALLAREADRGEKSHRDNSEAFLLARGVCAFAYLVGLGLILWRARSASAAALGTFGLWIILSPVVHPWYLLMVLPFAILERRASWLLLSVTALGTYVAVEAYHRTGVWKESWLAWGIEYGSFYPLLIWEETRMRIARMRPIPRINPLD